MTDPGKIRNIALVGHRGTGKTSLLEAMLYRGGVVNRLGKVEDGTTVSDYDDDEKRRQLSLQGTLAHIERERPHPQPDRHPRRPELPGRHDRGAARRRDGPHHRQLRARGRGADRASLGPRRTSAGWRGSSSATCSTASAPTWPPRSPRCARLSASRSCPCSCPSAREHEFRGVVDLLTMKAHTLDGQKPVGRRRPGRARRRGGRGSRDAHRGGRRDQRRAAREVPRRRRDQRRRAQGGDDSGDRRRPALPGGRRLGDASRGRRPAARPPRHRAGAE